MSQFVPEFTWPYLSQITPARRRLGLYLAKPACANVAATSSLAQTADMILHTVSELDDNVVSRGVGLLEKTETVRNVCTGLS